MTGQALPLGGQVREGGEQVDGTKEALDGTPLLEEGGLAELQTWGTSEGAISQGCPANG